jgi:cardiolipin synthase
LLVVPVVLLLMSREFGLALVLFALAGISDGLDGYLAKRNHWASRLGSILDPLADKVLLISSYLVLGWLGEIPVWLVVVVLARDVVIVMGGLAYHYLIEQYDMNPTLLSKLNTLFQIILVLAVVFSLGLYRLPENLIVLLTYIVTVTTVLSGANYVWVWGARAVSNKQC